MTFEAGWVSTSPAQGSCCGVEDFTGCDEYAGGAQGSLITFSNGPSNNEADGILDFTAAAACAESAVDRPRDF